MSHSQLRGPQWLENPQLTAGHEAGRFVEDVESFAQQILDELFHLSHAPSLLDKKAGPSPELPFGADFCRSGTPM